MTTSFQIENLKCNGCASSIKKGLTKLDSVKNINIDVATSTVEVETTQEISKEIHTELSKLGYPVVGDKNTLGHKAKSFVSCAIGRMSED